MTAAPRTLFPATLFVALSASAVYFAGSAAAPALTQAWGLTGSGAAALSWAVHVGFVVGTLGVAALDLPDRLAPGKLIAVLLVAAAAVNAALLWAPSLGPAVALRFAAGALAGPVYPVAMRLLATWEARLGPRLGTLLGAYTLGAGASFVLQATGFPWQESVVGASVLALVAAAVAPRLLQPGRRLPTTRALDLKAALRSLEAPAYRWSSFAYYGHMWELFAVWGLIPFWLAAAGWSGLSLAGLVTVVYVAGALGCFGAGLASRALGEARVAGLALAASLVLAATSPWWFEAPHTLQAVLVAAWGAAVVADSPMFSALSAHAAPPAYVGSALTVQNGVGFAIAAVSLALVGATADAWGSWKWVFAVLALGPLVGLWFVARLVRGAPVVAGVVDVPTAALRERHTEDL